MTEVSSPAPTVTVILPTYNRADLLPRALESVLAQTFRDFELLVVDDGSTDSTAELVKKYSDSRIRLLSQPSNMGVSAARNRGLREARGELVAFIDSDDEWLSRKLEEQVSFFREAENDVGLVYCGSWTTGDPGGERRDVPRWEGELGEILTLSNPIHATSGVMVRRNVVKEVGFFDEEIPAIEDFDYWTRIARRYRVGSMEEVLVRYDDRKEEGRQRKSTKWQENMDARAYFFRKHARAMREVGAAHLFLLESARRCLVPGQWRPRQARKLLRASLGERTSLTAVALFLLSFAPCLLRRVAGSLTTRLVLAAEAGYRRRWTAAAPP
jgi:glycosyltransferase involved in cell wall biosynthesis